jgi:hypothetical protein
MYILVHGRPNVAYETLQNLPNELLMFDNILEGTNLQSVVVSENLYYESIVNYLKHYEKWAAHISKKESLYSTSSRIG